MLHPSSARCAHGAIVALATCIAWNTCSQTAHGAAFEQYGASFREIAMPPIASGSFGVAGDILPDGRILAVTGTSVYVETGVGTGAFTLAATIDGALVGGATDPAFLRISPGGRVALGAGFGKPVIVFDASTLGARTRGATVIDAGNAAVYNVEHFDGAWRDETSLAISGGAFGEPAFVSLLDTTSNPAAPVNPTIIGNVGGAPGGVAFDDAGRLYTANGFDTFAGGSGTGWVKAFDPSEWSMAPADFEVNGVLIGDILSGASLRFDHEGNLFVGGGDFSSGDFGTLAIVRAEAVMDAILGGGPVGAFDAANVRRLDPRGDGFGFYGAAFNPVTRELYMTDGGMWWATVPAPAGAVVFGLGAAAFVRRRRDGW